MVDETKVMSPNMECTITPSNGTNGIDLENSTIFRISICEVGLIYKRGLLVASSSYNFARLYLLPNNVPGCNGMTFDFH